MEDEIEKLLNHPSFRPFVITLTSGERFEIRYAGLVAIGRSMMHRFMPHSDQYQVIRSSQIASIHVLDEPAQAKSA